MTLDIDRYIAGEILEGEDARRMLDECQNRPWRFWVSLALGYLRDGQDRQAMYILAELMESDR